MTGTHISLFSGVGMTDIAAEAAGFETIATAEIDKFNREVLKVRLPNAHHYADVRDVNRASGIQHRIRRPLLVSGGFPCQDVSSSGTGLGLAGERSGLWSELLRVIVEFKPDYVLIENSTMLRNRGLDRVLRDLYEAGYDAKWDCIPAAAVGANHLRDRIWIVAKPSNGSPQDWWREATGDMTWKGQITYRTGKNYGTAMRRLPRAGEMVGRFVRPVEPKYTIKAAREALAKHTCLCPATPTGGWPTPAASNPQDGESPESWLARRELLKAKGINGNGAGMPLSVAVRMFPTPTKSDGSGGPGTTPKREGGKNLRTVVAEEEGNGRLNPEWVEWMMGLPIGWTDPNRSTFWTNPHRGWGKEPVVRTSVANSPNRAKRIRALGNGLVPQVAAIALETVLNW